MAIQLLWIIESEKPNTCIQLLCVFVFHATPLLSKAHIMITPDLGSSQNNNQYQNNEDRLQ